MNDFCERIPAMILEEKAALMSGAGNFTTKAIPRLGIPALYLSDGPHGLRKQAGASDHLGLNASQPATCYPPAATMANTWDQSLGEELGLHLGAEAVAQGVNMVLGPGLNMKRSPLCGRNFEYFSEDPYLAGKMAAAYIRGIQSHGVAACPKHFAVNNQETLRMHNDSIVDERTLREIYLTGFEIAVQEGKPLAIMSAYNKINGTYANEDHRLLREILVDDWGFDGMVVTDWGASDDRVASLVAGSHLEMPATGGDSDRELVAAVRSGKITESLLDERVAEYLQVVGKTVLPEQTAVFSQVEHHQFARRAAAAAIVLLKNEEAILPLAPSTRVAVIGDFADQPRYQGFGSSVVNPTQVDSPISLLMSSGLEVVGYSAGYLRNGGEDKSRIEAAVALARQAEVVLLYLGLDELSESEGLDRQHLKIHPNQVDLLKAVAAVNPNVVAVLAGGAPFETPWIGHCKAVIHGYLSGQAGAGAMVDAILGAVNPSGKLAETWPLALADTPAHAYYPGQEKTSEYREGPFIGYRYYETAGIPVRFPFGFGLSYTTFAYDNLLVRPDGVQFTLANTGTVAGAEVAQLYVSAGSDRLYRPTRELKGFAKVHLQPGESKTVTIPFDDKTFRYFSIVTGQFEIETGEYQVQIGASVADIRLTGSLTVQGTTAPLPDQWHGLPSYFSGQITAVGDEEFTRLLGRPLPPARWDRSQLLERNDTFSQLFYARGWLGRLVYWLLARMRRKAERKGQPDLNVAFIANMPIRGIAKLMGGRVNMAMADAILEIFNGRAFRGLAHLVVAWLRFGRARKKTAQLLAHAAAPSPAQEGA